MISLANLIAWVIQPKNAILTAILVAFLGLFAHDRYLKHEVNIREEKITSLNKNINELKASIELQNLAIKKMNSDFIAQKEEFNKNYNEVQKTNKPKVDRIAKQELYVSPPTVVTTTDEVNQGRNLLKDYIKNRKGGQ